MNLLKRFELLYLLLKPMTIVEDDGGGNTGDENQDQDDDVTVNHNENDNNEKTPTPEEIEAAEKKKAEEDDSGKTDDESEPGTGEAGKAPDDENAEGQDGSSKKALKRRIFKESQKRKELEKTVEELKAKVETKEPELQEPKRDDFDSLEEFFNAREDFVRKQAEKETEARIEKERGEESEKQESEKLLRGWETQKEAARDRYDDFDETLELSEAPVTGVMAQYMMETELGADMSYYLSNHVEEAKKIAALSPMMQAKALVTLEGTVQAEVEKSTKKPVSGAPEPHSEVKGSTSGSEEPNEKDDTKTWMEKRRKQKAANR